MIGRRTDLNRAGGGGDNAGLVMRVYGVMGFVGCLGVHIKKPVQVQAINAYS